MLEVRGTGWAALGRPQLLLELAAAACRPRCLGRCRDARRPGRAAVGTSVVDDRAHRTAAPTSARISPTLTVHEAGDATGLLRKLKPSTRSSRRQGCSLYTLTNWDRLTRFVDDPRIPLDNNATERAIRGPSIVNSRSPTPGRRRTTRRSRTRTTRIGLCGDREHPATRTSLTSPNSSTASASTGRNG